MAAHRRQGLVVGRLATIVAMRLRGKHKPSFTPHIDDGDNVIVVNAEKVVLTGRKRDQKVYYHYSGFIGGIKERTAKSILDGRYPSASSSGGRAHAAARPAGKKQLGNLKVYKAPDHPHAGAVARSFRRRQAQSEEQPERLIHGRDNSFLLADLKETALAPAVVEAPVSRAEARQAGPRLRDRQAQERRRSRLDQPGKGQATVNGKALDVYFARPVLRMILNQPPGSSPTASASTISPSPSAGGGLLGQAGAVRHGLAKALTYYEPELRAPLRKRASLTRDIARRRTQEVRPRQGRRSFPVPRSAEARGETPSSERAASAALFVGVVGAQPRSLRSIDPICRSGKCGRAEAKS